MPEATGESEGVGGASPEATGESEGGEAPKQDTAEKAGAAGDGGSGLDISDLFDVEAEADEAYQDLVASVDEVAASDLAAELRDLMSSLDKGS